MNVPLRHQTAAQQLTIVDCDIHPAYRAPADLYPFLPARWREHMTTFGEHLRQGLSGQLAWPRMMAAGMRLDAYPEQGPPGSDLALMRRQHLDANGVEYGMLMQLSRGGMEERIFVRGDRKVDYGTVMRVMGRLSGAGFHRVALVTEVEQGK